MSSNELMVQAKGLGKKYELYSKPVDRLKQLAIHGLGALGVCREKKLYQELWAVKDLSFEINKGESFGIVGRNGSGKSTLLQLITGVLAPTTGTIKTSGRVAALLELGSGFNPEFTGRENVYLNGALLGLTKSEIDDRFDLIAGFADIGTYLDQPVKTYSSGMLVRLAFAVQVQLRPDLLIVDEALAVGDALFQKRCFQKMEKLLADGTTLILVSHDQEVIRTLTQRSILLKNGRCIGQGKSAEILLSYRRLLHEEESQYLLRQRADIGKSLPSFANIESPPGADFASGVQSEKSFGDNYAQIKNVEILNAAGEKVSVFYVGEIVRIRVRCITKTSIEKLNVSVRLRNKEGFKIYSWGTLNQDMKPRQDEIFWKQQFKSGQEFIVDMNFECTLGANLYEVQAGVTYEDEPNYKFQRMLHWLDEAAFFNVLMKKDENYFGGLVDLKMSASWTLMKEEVL